MPQATFEIARSNAVDPSERRGPESLLPPELVFDAANDRRMGRRLRLRLPALLIPLGSAEPMACHSDDVGAGGIHVTVPVGYGVGVGQRYELVLTPTDHAHPANDAQLAARLQSQASQYVTVVRTQVHVDSNGDRVGVGLRFDQPVLF